MAAEPRNGQELARLLMQKAAGDEIVLVRLVEDDDVPDDVLGFHGQQAVEKMIKAVLAYNAISYERTHNITYLLTLLDSAAIPQPEHADSLPDLTPWAAGFRYADLPEPALTAKRRSPWSNRPGPGPPSNLGMPEREALELNSGS